jgi:predicted transglutaminase-like cysteine proteinase
MTSGTAAPAPAGFLRFCARMPAQCGLEALGDLQPGPDEAAISHALTARYYWPRVFPHCRTALDLPTPTSGGPRRFFRPSAPSADWSQIFRLTPAALAAARAPDAPSVSASPASATVADAGPIGAEDAAVLAAAIEETTQPVVPLSADGALLARLTEVSRRVNRAIRYVPEQRVSGDADTWRLPLSPGERAAGDCKAYVLEKRRALIEDGVAPSNLSIAIVQTPWGETHARLLAITDHGKRVLDSLSERVRPWRQVRYTWLARQGLGVNSAGLALRAKASGLERCPSRKRATVQPGQ